MRGSMSPRAGLKTEEEKNIPGENRNMVVMVSFTTDQRGKSPVNPLTMKLGEPQSWSGRFSEKKHLFPAANQTTIPLLHCP
jgi:hypothetical protein